MDSLGHGQDWMHHHVDDSVFRVSICKSRNLRERTIHSQINCLDGACLFSSEKLAFHKFQQNFGVCFRKQKCGLLGSLGLWYLCDTYLELMSGVRSFLVEGNPGAVARNRSMALSLSLSPFFGRGRPKAIRTQERLLQLPERVERDGNSCHPRRCWSITTHGRTGNRILERKATTTSWTL